jgi:hypothetical protein
MKLQELIEKQGEGWVVWQQEDFFITEKMPRQKQVNRETLARLYAACINQVQQNSKATYEEASRIVRSLWIEESEQKPAKSLPRILGEDGFLRMYALGAPCSLTLLRRILRRTLEPMDAKVIQLEPIYVEWNEPATRFYDVDATPPGLLSKFIRTLRLKKDRELLRRIASDLETVSKFNEAEKRKLLTLAILSHGAAYRELEGHQIFLPSFTEKEKLIPYICRQHLIAEGLKTVSLIPLIEEAKAIYLCQGTEFWPSQPSMLGSIIANFGEHGSATEAYAHSWRRIHQHLRELKSPLVAGHSMGGSLAIQIGLYSHNLVDCAYAFNPPVPNERDYAFYQQLSAESQKKIQIIANLDDFAFWRIGSKIIGNVTLFLGKKRWKYYAVNLWDCILLIPAFIKFIRNVHHAFPAHQRIAALYENWVWVNLTQEEIEKENYERTRRFDYLSFLPKLYDPLKVLLTYIRRIFKWGLEKEYLSNEIEIIALHERDLLDTLTEANHEEIERELNVLRKQKNHLLQKLLKRK